MPAAAGAAKPTAASPAAPRASEAAGASTQGYTVEREPAWVVRAAEPAQGASATTAPMHYRVVDEQVRVEGRTAQEYRHVVRVIDASAALGIASQIEVEFDPAYQSVALHQLDVVRDGVRRSRIGSQRVQVLQREKQLERRVVDGRMTLSIVLEDVRVGDQIDFAYSLRGANPVFGGRFVHIAWLGSENGPVAVYQFRLLAPEARRLQTRTGSPAIQVASKLVNGWRDTTFRLLDAAQMTGDTWTSVWAVWSPRMVQVSEFTDWADVARWGQTLFANGASGPNVGRQAAAIREAHAEQAQQVLAALDFVQREVRYFGTESGANSHRPARPEVVIAQRFGDCKDKVALLVALLRELGVRATPVLVSTSSRERVSEFLPSPLAFNHVVALVEVGGRSYLLDATRSHQTGALVAREVAGFGAGLPLEESTSAVVALAIPFDTLRLGVTDRVIVSRFPDPPRLDARIVMRGDVAEAYREALASRPIEAVTTDLTQHYARIYPKLRPLGPMRAEPVPDDDAIAFVQSFEIPEFWRFPEQRALVADAVQWSTAEALAAPRAPSRRDPFSFGLPGIYRHAWQIDFPEDVLGEGSEQNFDDAISGVSLSLSARSKPRSIAAVSEVRIGAYEVAAADWPAYQAKLDRLLPRLASTVSVSAIPPAGRAALADRLKALESALRSQRRQPSRVQLDAQVKVAILDAQIDGKRLAPNLLAQAYSARGIQTDLLGQPEKARSDFDQALALAPTSAEILSAAAVNTLMRADYRGAIDLADRALERAPGNDEGLNARAQAHYFLGNWASAEADFAAILKSPAAVRRGYPIIWLSLTMRHAGKDPAMLAAAYPADMLPTDWPRPLVDFALGKSTAEAALDAAKSQKVAAEALSEAYFYAGESLHAQGDLSRAAAQWRRCVDQGVVEFLEDGFARNRLAPKPGS